MYVPPQLKGNDFYEIIKAYLKDKIETIEPAEGTSPWIYLKEH